MRKILLEASWGSIYDAHMSTSLPGEMLLEAATRSAVSE